MISSHILHFGLSIISCILFAPNNIIILEKNISSFSDKFYSLQSFTAKLPQVELDILLLFSHYFSGFRNRSHKDIQLCKSSSSSTDLQDLYLRN